MVQKRCGLGLDCSSMMQSPGLDPGNCDNYKVCGGAQQYTDEDLIELVRVGEERWERLRITRTEAAIMMLMQRGNPQSLEDFSIPNLLSEIEELFESVKEKLNQFENVYIAPESVEAHRYSVKRLSGTYIYNKITAKEPIFEPSERTQKVKVLHLSRDDDPRNIEGRLGIERRNKLTQLRTKLREIKSRLNDAQTLLE